MDRQLAISDQALERAGYDRAMALVLVRSSVVLGGDIYRQRLHHLWPRLLHKFGVQPHDPCNCYLGVLLNSLTKKPSPV